MKKLTRLTLFLLISFLMFLPCNATISYDDVYQYRYNTERYRMDGRSGNLIWECIGTDETDRLAKKLQPQEGPPIYQFIVLANIPKEDMIKAYEHLVQTQKYDTVPDYLQVSLEEIDILYSGDFRLIIETFRNEDTFLTNDNRLYTEEEINKKLNFEELLELKDDGVVEYLEKRLDDYRKSCYSLAEYKISNGITESPSGKSIISNCERNTVHMREFIDSIRIGVAPQTGTPTVPLAITAAALAVLIRKNQNFFNFFQKT